MKKILIFCLFLIFLVSSVYSSENVIEMQLNSEQEHAIGNLVGETLNDQEILAKGIEFRKIGDQSVFVFLEEDSSLTIKGNKFENIKPRDDADCPTHIFVNEIGEIILAEFITNEKGGSYNLNELEFEVDPNSKIYYERSNQRSREEETLQLLGGGKLKNIQNRNKNLMLRIGGNDVKISKDIWIKKGYVIVNERGYILEENGEAIYKQIFLSYSRFNENVLILNEGETPPKDIGWIRQTSDKIEAKGLYRTRFQILENNEIMEIGERDKLIFELELGDGLIINKGINNLPPKIIHKSSKNGAMIIKNDGSYVVFVSGEIRVYPQMELSLEDLEKGKFLGVSMEVESDSEIISEKLIYDSKGKILMISNDQEQRVIFEKKFLPDSLINMKQEDLNYLIEAFSPYFEFSGIKKDNVFMQLLNSLKPNQIIEILNEVLLKEKNAIWGLFTKLETSYDDQSFEDFKQGLLISSSYLKTSHFMFAHLLNSGFNFEYSNIVDKKSFIDEYTNGIESYFENNDLPDPFLTSRMAILINLIHDNEGAEEGSDIIRQEIAKKTSFKTKYYLISQSNENLYQSTFEKLYGNFPENALEEIKKIDPAGNFWGEFMIQMGARDKLNDFLEQDVNFFLDNVYKSLENPENIEINTGSLANSISELYENPKYKNEKFSFEEKLVNLYLNAEGLDEKSSYAFLMRLDGNPISSNLKNIQKSIPELPEVNLPSCNSEVCIAKQYFYGDNAAWLDITKEAYLNPIGIYKFNLVKEGNKQTILEKKLPNGKTMRMILTADISDAKNILQDDQTILVVHRGHSYDAEKIFSGSSDKEKIIFDGGCWGPKRVYELQKSYPNSQLIYDKNTGEGAVTQYEAYKILKAVTLGERNWDDLKEDIEDEKGISFPNEKTRLLSTYKKILEGYLYRS